MILKHVKIGDADLYLGDCRDIIPTLGKVDAVITDPPYSERCHAGHNASIRRLKDKRKREQLAFDSLTISDVAVLAEQFAEICDGWIVWFTDSDLAPTVRAEMAARSRTTFPPLPYYAPGSRVRMSGDGPSSWTDWIVVSRTVKQARWGTLPGGYAAGDGWFKEPMMPGGKPVPLMCALVNDYSKPGQKVLDSHMGWGTTGVACAKLGRSFIGCEHDPERFEVACERIAGVYNQLKLF